MLNLKYMLVPTFFQSLLEVTAVTPRTVNGLYLRLPDFGGSAAYERYLPAGCEESAFFFGDVWCNTGWSLTAVLARQRRFCSARLLGGQETSLLLPGLTYVDLCRDRISGG